MPDVRVAVPELRSLVAAVFVGEGLPPEDAATTAWAIVDGDVRGQRGHGVTRVPLYLGWLHDGTVNPRPRIRTARASAVAALVDGDHGMGHVVVRRAVDLAEERARVAGIGWVGVRNGNHAGAAGVYTGLLADHGLVGIYLAVSGRNFMAPHGGADPLLGTNPLAIAVPAAEGPHFELDMSTAVAPWGRIRRALAHGESLPEGWMVDRDGRPLTDPGSVEDGLLRPIAGAKGSGLAMAIGLLAGVLNGAAFGADLDDAGASGGGTGQTVVAVRPDLLRDAGEVTRDVARHLADVRASTPLPGGEPVRPPGSGMAARRADHLAHGVPVDEALLGRLRDLAD